MPGKGPAKGANPNTKPSDQRRNRNQAAPLDALPAAGYTGKFPPLPKSYATGGRTKTGKPKRNVFLPSTRKWYETWCKSPMAIEFTTVHFLRMQHVAILQDRFDRGEHELAAELRLQLAGFGGTPYDVRRLGKTIRATGVAGGDKKNASAEPPKLAEVRRLHAV